jgi:hypothetical protein
LATFVMGTRLRTHEMWHHLLRILVKKLENLKPFHQVQHNR